VKAASKVNLNEWAAQFRELQAAHSFVEKQLGGAARRSPPECRLEAVMGPFAELARALLADLGRTHVAATAELAKTAKMFGEASAGDVFEALARFAAELRRAAGQNEKRAAEAARELARESKAADSGVPPAMPPRPQVSPRGGGGRRRGRSRGRSRGRRLPSPRPPKGRVGAAAPVIDDFAFLG